MPISTESVSSIKIGTLRPAAALGQSFYSRSASLPLLSSPSTTDPLQHLDPAGSGDDRSLWRRNASSSLIGAGGDDGSPPPPPALAAVKDSLHSLDHTRIPRWILSSSTALDPALTVDPLFLLDRPPLQLLFFHANTRRYLLLARARDKGRKRHCRRVPPWCLGLHMGDRSKAGGWGWLKRRRA